MDIFSVELGHIEQHSVLGIAFADGTRFLWTTTRPGHQLDGHH